MKFTIVMTDGTAYRVERDCTLWPSDKPVAIFNTRDMPEVVRVIQACTQISTSVANPLPF